MSTFACRRTVSVVLQSTRQAVKRKVTYFQLLVVVLDYTSWRSCIFCKHANKRRGLQIFRTKHSAQQSSETIKCLVLLISWYDDNQFLHRLLNSNILVSRISLNSFIGWDVLVFDLTRRTLPSSSENTLETLLNLQLPQT